MNCSKTLLWIKWGHIQTTLLPCKDRSPGLLLSWRRRFESRWLIMPRSRLNPFIKYLTWVREHRINWYWKSVATNFQIPRFIMLSYITTNSTILNFYHLIETHKNSPVTKIKRVNRPTKKVAGLLSRILTRLLPTVSSHLESNAQLMNDINHITRHSNHPYPCSLDICSIYTSSPP